MNLFRQIHKHLVVESFNRFFSTVAFPAIAAPSLRLCGAKIGKNARIYTPLVLHNTVFSNLRIGDNCHVGRDVFLDLTDRIEIGDNVTISMRCTFTTHFDPCDAPLVAKRYPVGHAPVVIEDDVYIGANCTILRGVTIGANSLVGASCLVRSDVPARCVFGGVPGRVIGAL